MKMLEKRMVRCKQKIQQVLNVTIAAVAKPLGRALYMDSAALRCKNRS
jgi:hypothetical protein